MKKIRLSFGMPNLFRQSKKALSLKIHLRKADLNLWNEKQQYDVIFSIYEALNSTCLLIILPIFYVRNSVKTL